MSENKFIKRLKGERTAKSVLEIKNESAKTSFANMPQGTSNAIDVFSDHRGNATAVLNGTTNWKISNSDLLLVETVSGDGQDFTSTYSVSGAGLWVNASYTFPSTGDPRHPVAMVFNPSTKWVLKICGDNLIVDGGSTVDFTMLVKIGTSNVYSKNFTIRENAGQFSKEFVIDFGEANSDVVKAGGLSTLTVQLLCGTANASARIYNGMTVLTCLQRKVDASAVSNSSANVEDVLDGNIIPSDYFSNPEFIDQIEDGEDAYAVFTRDGDDVNLSGWTPKDDIATTTQLNDEITARENADLGLQNQINTNKDTMDGHIANTSNPHQVTKAQVGLGNVDNTSDLDKPISTATQTALDLKMPISTKYGASISLTIDSSTYVLTAQLKDQDNNNLGTAQTIDLPLESVVVSGSYDSDTKEVILVLENGSEIRFSVADLISGLQSEITAQNPLDADLVNDSTSAHKFVTATEKTNWNNHIANTNNPHQVTKAQVGLGNVDNTSDLNKPISTATQTALDLKADKSTTYTKTETDTLLSGKQDNISDLATIRSGAALGATAVQPSDLAAVATSGSYNDLSDKPTIGNATLTIQKNGTTVQTFTANQSTNATANISVPTKTSDITNDSGFITSSALAPYALSADLATVATSGDYDDLSNKPTIPTVGNGTITITQGGISKGTFTTNQSGNTTIALDAGGGGIGNIDNLTITENASQEIQAVAVIDQNTGIVKTWTGTMAEYEAIVTKDPETEYIIIDDIGGSATEIGEITEALNNKVDKGHQVIEFQEPTSANNWTWYRKYADGWVEQGGRESGTLSGNVFSKTLVVPMKNNGYFVSLLPVLGSSDTENYYCRAIDSSTNTQIKYFVYLNGSVTTNNPVVYWQVSGMAA